MKRRIYIFKSKHTKFRLSDLKPLLSFDHNVQGWYYTKNYSLYWLTYCLNIEVTIIDHKEYNRTEAHELNVNKYIISK